MKQTIEIEVPQGYEAKYDPITNKVEIVKKDFKPKSWEEFCKNSKITDDECFIASDSATVNNQELGLNSKRDASIDRNLCTSQEEAEAFLALMQLRQLRKAWIGDWNHIRKVAGSILYDNNGDITVMGNCSLNHPLNFPTKEMANEFLKCFGDLIEKAKILL